MTAFLTDRNRKEIKVTLSALAPSGRTEPEESLFTVDSHLLKASIAGIRTAEFSIIDIRLRNFECFRTCSPAGEDGSLRFSAALQGTARCLYEPMREDFIWRNGHASLQSCGGGGGGGGGCTLRSPQKPFRMMMITLSRSYVRKIMTLVPSLFDEILCSRPARSSLSDCPATHPFSPAVGEALNGILNYRDSGSGAALYLDAKIREILSLFPCRQEREKDCCSCVLRDREKIIRAKEIIEQRHQNPPSLHELSLMVGTNECALKNGFKMLFGTTVYGYLFDCRMRLAGRYLSATDKTIQEIAALVGYEHQSHFSTAFKRKFRLSPQQYRAGVQAPASFNGKWKVDS